MTVLHCWGADPVFPPVPAGFRIGMEIELLPQAFANLTRHFDFEALQTEFGPQVEKNLPDTFFDHYLSDSPQALSDLPSEIREKLTQGLHLDSLIERPTPSLLGSDGRPIDRSAQRKKSASPFHQEGSLEVPKRLAWQTLFDRWAALHPTEKRKIARWENLSPSKKAQLALDTKILFSLEKLKIKKDAPEADKKLFEKFHWSQDRAAIEFRHRENVIVSDPNEFYRDVLGLAARAGAHVEKQILNPQASTARDSSFHYHVSVDGKDLTSQGEALNRLAFVRRIHQGILNDLTNEGYFLYSPSAESKGLVRVVDYDRIEFRFHTTPLVDELRFNLSVLTLDKKEGLKVIDSEIKKWMSDYVVDKISSLRLDYLSDFTKYMSKKQRARIRSQIETAKFIKNLPHKIPPDFWARAPELLKSDEPLVRNLMIETLKLHRDQATTRSPKSRARCLSSIVQDLRVSKNH